MTTTLSVKERPVLFSAPMVRAILDGSKTQTRRVVKPIGIVSPDSIATAPLDVLNVLCPYGQPGDRLWVRETFAQHALTEYSGGFHGLTGEMEIRYRASGHALGNALRWSPSIHMPRWASRITLEITDVRVERVQDISERDAEAEGAEPIACDPASIVFNTWKAQHRFRDGFTRLWNEINAARGFGWDVNPWVWCISFRRHSEEMK